MSLFPDLEWTPGGRLIHNEREAGSVELKPGWIAAYGIGVHYASPRHEIYIRMRQPDGTDIDRIVGTTSVPTDVYDTTVGRESIRDLRRLHVALLRRMIHLSGQTDEAKLYAAQQLLVIEEERIGQ